VHVNACDVSIRPPPHLTLFVQPQPACLVSSLLCSLCPPRLPLCSPGPVMCQIHFALPPCPCYCVRNSVVPVMPTATLVDTVILSQPPPAPIQSSPFVELRPSGGSGILACPPHPRSTPTTPSSHPRARHAISGPTTRLGSACMRLPVSMCELNLLRATSLQIHASERTPTNVFSARHTGACVCVCAPRHMFVCVCVHMYVFTCGLA